MADATDLLCELANLQQLELSTPYLYQDDNEFYSCSPDKLYRLAAGLPSLKRLSCELPKLEVMLGRSINKRPGETRLMDQQVGIMLTNTPALTHLDLSSQTP